MKSGVALLFVASECRYANSGARVTATQRAATMFIYAAARHATASVFFTFSVRLSPRRVQNASLTFSVATRSRPGGRGCMMPTCVHGVGVEKIVSGEEFIRGAAMQQRTHAKRYDEVER